MDLIKIQLEKLSRGHVMSLCGVVVMRRGDSFIFGETINVRDKGSNIDEASRGIYELMRK